MALPPIVVSGTDPTNPRSAADIVARLEQIQRDTAAMVEETGRLWMYADSIRDVLRDEQGVPDRKAQEATRPVLDQIHQLRVRLLAVSVQAGRSIEAIDETKVSKKIRFGWRPARTAGDLR